MAGDDEGYVYGGIQSSDIHSDFNPIWIAQLILGGGISSMTNEAILFGDRLIFFPMNGGIAIQQNYYEGFDGIFLDGLFYGNFRDVKSKHEVYDQIMYAHTLNNI